MITRRLELLGAYWMREDVLLQSSAKARETHYWLPGKMTSAYMRGIGILILTWGAAPAYIAERAKDQAERDALTWRPQSGAATQLKT